MRSPKISVIIPAFNQAVYLGGAIQSVLDQSYDDFEILVVDDGSSDDTADVAANFNDPRLHYVYQENKGLPAARNTGVRLTNGEYVTFLDSDDKFLPEHLALLSSELDRRPEIGFVAGGVIQIDQNGRHLGDVVHPQSLEPVTKFLLGNLLPVGTMIVRRSWLEQVGGFDETLRAKEDWDLWLRMALAGCRMSTIPQPVFLYRFYLGQMTREGERMQTATFAVLNKVYSREDLPKEWKEVRNRAYARAHLVAAAHAVREGRSGDATAEFAEAVRLDPALCEQKHRQLAEMFSAWSNDPRMGDRLQFLEAVYASLPACLNELRKERRRYLARAALEIAFTAYKQANYLRARKALSSALLYEPRRLRNRGIVSLFVRSWFHTIMPN